MNHIHLERWWGEEILTNLLDKSVVVIDNVNIPNPNLQQWFGHNAKFDNGSVEKV